MITQDLITASEVVFTEKEKGIIRLICLQKSSKEIGQLLGISKKQVDNSRAEIMVKTNSKNMAGIVVYAIANGIFELNQNEE